MSMRRISRWLRPFSYMKVLASKFEEMLRTYSIILVSMPRTEISTTPLTSQPLAGRKGPVQSVARLSEAAICRLVRGCHFENVGGFLPSDTREQKRIERRHISPRCGSRSILRWRALFFAILFCGGEYSVRATYRIICVAALTFALGIPAFAQIGLFSNSQRVEFTPDWHGERFPDGRPKVPDSVLARLSNVTADEAWDVLQGAGFRNQFEGKWKVINPGDRLVGRVVTAVFMPYRPDVGAVIRANGKKEGRIGEENSWVIDTLKPGDVLVVDLFGKIKFGTFVGDNLATSVYAKSHNGLIVDGSVRDVTGIKEIKGFQVYVRGVDPTDLQNVMLTGINVPIRIGQTTVMPGDIAVGDPEGVTFVPPQMAEKLADEAEMDHRVDDWGHMMLREGKYTPGEIDGRWTKPMIDQFNQWLGSQGSKLRMPVR